jgi:aspartate/methionine/tyrosine aminotransferase
MAGQGGTDSGVCTRRCEEMSPFQVMEILEAAHRLEREGKRVIHLEIGEPDFDAPECVKEACARAVRENKTHYTHSLGIIELREAICRWQEERYGVSTHPDQVIVTQGTSPAMFLLFSALLEAGDNVIVSDPAYACYPNFVEFAGGECRRVRVTEADGWQYRPEGIRAALDERTRAVLINSPSNPTGTLLSAERQRAIAAIAEDASGPMPFVVSDEIYQGLTYEGRDHTIREFTDRAFVLNGFSKLFAMTGFRLGYLIAPRETVRPMQKVCQNFFISANAMAQWAGVAALEDSAEDVARMVRQYDARRRALLARLRGMGFSISCEPTGAFYVLADFREQAAKFGGSSLALAFDILEKVHLGVTPGIDFGPGAEGHLRFSYANSLENIEDGMDRLARYLEG